MKANDLAIFSDMNDALTSAVHALGGYKKVGIILRPELATNPASAAQWLRDCLNPDKRERLTPEQTLHLLRLAREADYHAAKHWIDAEVGYEPSRPIDLDAKEDLLVQVIAQTTETLSKALSALERTRAAKAAAPIARVA